MECGEDSMQGLVRHQVVSILQPIAEEVHDLQAQIDHLRKDIAHTEGRVDQHKKTLDNQDREILANRAADKEMYTIIDKIRVEAVKDQEELGRTQQDLQGTKAALSKLNEKTHHSKAQAELTDQRVVGLAGNVSNLQKDLESVGELFRGHKKDINQLQDSNYALHNQHQKHFDKLDQASAMATNTDRVLNKFMKDHKHQCDEDMQILANITKQMNELAAVLDDTRQAVHNQGLDLQAVYLEIRHMTPSAGQEGGTGFKIERMERIQAETVDNLQRTMERLAKADHTIADLAGEFKGTKLTIQESLRELGLKISENVISISELARRLQRQGDALKDTTWRADKVARDQKRLYEQQALTDKEVVGLHNNYKTTNDRLEGYQHEQQRTRADLTVLGREADSGLTQLRGDIGTANTNLSKLTSRFEATNQNIQGVGKGLQDVTRHTLMGEHNLLSPKSVRHKMPPIQVRTPRTGLSPSPILGLGDVG